MLEFVLLALALPFVALGAMRAMGFAFNFPLLHPFYPYLVSAVLTLSVPFLASKIVMPYLLHPHRFYTRLLTGSGHSMMAWRPPSLAVQKLLTVLSAFVMLLLGYRVVAMSVAQQHCNRRRVNRRFVNVYALKMTALATAVYLALQLVPDVTALVPVGQRVPFAQDVTLGVAMAAAHVPMLVLYYAFQIRAKACR